MAVQFTWEPDTLPDDWRELVALLDGTIEVDETIELDGVPATRLVYTWTTSEVSTREMVVLVPARGIVILAQPVLEAGEVDGPQRFLDHADVFADMLARLTFGAPQRD